MSACKSVLYKVVSPRETDQLLILAQAFRVWSLVVMGLMSALGQP